MTQPKLQFRQDGKFTLLQVSDPQDMHFVRRSMLRMLDTAYDLVRPDFVLFTGDNILGNHLTDARFGDRRDAWDKATVLKRMRKAINYIAEPVEKRGIPFGAVYGNHDDMNEIPRREQSEIYRGYSRFVGLNQTEPDVSEDTCVLPILSSDGSRVAFNLWTMDSTGHNDDGSEEYNYVPKADIDWYVRTSEQMQADNGGEKIPSLMFQHITVPEIEELVEDGFDGRVGALGLVAGGAARHDIAAGAAAAAGHGDHVVHRELLRRDLLAAVVADAALDLRLPPRGLAQLAGAGALAGHVCVVLPDIDPVSHRRRPGATSSRRCRAGRRGTTCRGRA